MLEYITPKRIIYFLGGLEGFIFGTGLEVRKYLLWLIIIMVFNIATLIFMAGKNHIDIRDYAIRSVVNLMFISFCHFLDIESGSNIQSIAIGAFIISEGYKVIENFVSLGVPVPEQIKNIFMSGGNNNGK